MHIWKGKCIKEMNTETNKGNELHIGRTSLIDFKQKGSMAVCCWRYFNSTITYAHIWGNTTYLRKYPKTDKPTNFSLLIISFTIIRGYQILNITRGRFQTVSRIKHDSFNSWISILGENKIQIGILYIKSKFKYE